jgi:hypothetical protein
MTPPASTAATRGESASACRGCRAAIRSDAIEELVVDRVKAAITDDAGGTWSALDLDALVDISNPLEPGRADVCRKRLRRAMSRRSWCSRRVRRIRG